MGILAQLAGEVTGALGGQSQDGAPQGALLGSLMGMIQSNGGLSTLFEKMKSRGLSDQVASWVGMGENQPVSGSQITEALGTEKVQEIAAQAGIEPEHASAGMDQLLPQLIDH